jgi:hypothetical protein
MPLQSTVPFMVIATIITVVGGAMPIAHYLIAGEVRPPRAAARPPHCCRRPFTWPCALASGRASSRAAQPRRTMIDNWDRMLFRRDHKIDRIVKEASS